MTTTSHQMRRQRQYQRQGGITMIEALAGIAILAITYLTLARLQMDQAQDLQLQAAASQMILVRQGAVRYVRDQNATIQADATAGGGVAEIDTADLIVDGYLPRSMAVDPVAVNPVLRPNPFLHDYRILVRQPDPAQPNVLEVLVVTDMVSADAIPLTDGDTGRVAQLMGTQGGVLCASTTDLGPCQQAALPDGSIVAQGAYGGWMVSLEDDPSFEDLGLPAAGGIASLAFTGANEIVADYLYRFEVPGVPEANQMFTRIDMNENPLINASGVGIRSDASTYDFEIGGGGGLAIALDADDGGGPALLMDMGGGLDRVLSSDGTTLFVGGSSNSLSLRTGGEDRLTIDGDGNVEITGGLAVATTITSGESIIAGEAGTRQRVELDPSRPGGGDVYLGVRDGFIGELLPNFVFKESFFEPNSSDIPMPNCPGEGEPKIVAMPRIIPIPQPSDFEAHSAVNIRAEFAGASNWRVIIESFRVIDTGGGGFSFVQEAPAQAWVLAQTYCYYAPA